MSSRKPNYPFLTESENVLHALETKNANFVVTDRRLVIQEKGDIQEDFDIKYIAHIYSEKKANDMLAMIFCLIGIISVILGISSSSSMIYIGFGIFMIIVGIFLFRLVSHKLIINLSGVSKPFEYDVNAPSEYVQRLVAKIAEIRSQ